MSDTPRFHCVHCDCSGFERIPQQTFPSPHTTRGMDDIFVSILSEQMLKSIVPVLLTRLLDGAANPSVVRGVPCLPAWVARDFASDMAPVFR